MIDSERQSIFYKLLITILSVYGLYLMLSIVRDKNNILEKIKKSIFKTKSIEYIFFKMWFTSEKSIKFFATFS